MKDIRLLEKDNVYDLSIEETTIYKAQNLLQVQEGSLNYASDFGLDLNLFINSDFVIQDITYRSYCLEKLSQYGINVLELLVDNKALKQVLNYKVAEVKRGGMII